MSSVVGFLQIVNSDIQHLVPPVGDRSARTRRNPAHTLGVIVVLQVIDIYTEENLRAVSHGRGGGVIDFLMSLWPVRVS